MVAFVASVLATALMVAPIVWVARRRPAGAPLSWGEAMLAASYLFFLMFLVYGVVPHQWLSWADNELKWRKDNLVFTANSIVPFDLSWLVVRDIIAVGIYVVAVAGQVWMWAWWQKRGKTKPAQAELTSSFGRPLVKKG